MSSVSKTCQSCADLRVRCIEIMPLLRLNECHGDAADQGENVYIAKLNGDLRASRRTGKWAVDCD
ncbi:hypothetical protein BJX64DRAFT_251566 [Aspergillus heterothallicus]